MIPRLKILFVLPSEHRIGGASRSAFRLITSLRTLGHTVFLIHPDSSCFPYERNQNEHVWGFHPYGGVQQFSSEVERAILHWDPDVILGWYISSGGFVAVSAGKLTNKPVVIAGRGNDLDLDFFHPERHAMVSWTIHNCDAITTVSSEMAYKINKWFGVKATFVSNSVDKSIFYPDTEAAQYFAQKFQIPKKPILGLFGEFKPKRGLELLSRIATEIEHWTPLIVGQIRPNVAHLVPPHSICIPYLFEDSLLRGAYGVCDVIIQPSLYDGMPNVVLESLACGCSLITSNVGGLRDLHFPLSNIQKCDYDEDWRQALEQARTVSNPTTEISLPNPEEEAVQFVSVLSSVI